MKNKRYGFTLVELLVVIAIIGILAGILLPSLGSASVRAQRAKVKAIITQLEQALSQYKVDEGKYPPDDESNGGEKTMTGTDMFVYSNDCLVKYLDGDDSTGGKAGSPYFDFQEQYLRKGNIYFGPFEEDFWYHNFHDDNVTSKKRNTSKPLHPWYNRLNFTGVQIYSRAQAGMEYGNPSKTPLNDIDCAYGDKGSNPTSDDFIWITNYTK